LEGERGRAKGVAWQAVSPDGQPAAAAQTKTGTMIPTAASWTGQRLSDRAGYESPSAFVGRSDVRREW